MSPRGDRLILCEIPLDLPPAATKRVGAGILGLAYDRRIAVARTPYFVAGLLGAVFPDHVMLILAATNLVAMWPRAGMLWRRKKASSA